MIYLDNAATTLHKPPQVAEAVVRAMTTLGNSSRGVYGSALDAARLVFETREKLASLLGCPRADHVVFAANSTEALNIALAGLFAPGDHILSTDLEHNSVLRPLYRLRQQGVAVDFLPADQQGCIDYDDFARLLRPETKAVVCTHASNLTGNPLDLERIGAFARAQGLLLVVDGSQSAGVFDVNMERQNIDVLCFTGHKSLLGPQGIGGLCVRPGVEIRPWKVGGTGVHTYLEEQPTEYPTRLEAGTLNGPGIAGLSAALDFITQTGRETIWQHELALMQRFFQGVSTLAGIHIYGDFMQVKRAPVVALNLGGWDSSQLADELSEGWGIATRPGAHCAPRLHRCLGTEEQGAVRFSFSWYNTEAEVDTALAALRELAEDV